MAAVGVLLVFHAFLFWAHIVDGRLFEPAVALRWTIGVALLGLIAGLRHIGVPMLWGRRALVVWVLVALLHVSAALPGSAGDITTATPQDMTLTWIVLPPAGVVLLTALLLAVALVGRFGALGARRLQCRIAHAATPLGTRLDHAHLPPRAPPIPASC